MSMAHALEVREPFLDHHLVEFVLTLPDGYKQYPKKLLTDAMGDLLPHDIVHRKKMGFVLPWELWLHHDLKNFILQQSEELKEGKLFNNKYLDSIYSGFFAGNKNISWPMVWNLSVLSYWIKENNIEC
jgi:asparagine synthase (glutamine-hydrolysing)